MCLVTQPHRRERTFRFPLLPQFVGFELVGRVGRDRTKPGLGPVRDRLEYVPAVFSDDVAEIARQRRPAEYRPRVNHGFTGILIPGDDLAFAAIIFGGIEQIAGLPPHQEFGAPCLDDVVAPAPRRGFLGHLFRKLRQREDLAPHPPGDFDLIGIRADAERNCQ
jgi:hypothetical protein